jgi:Fe-S-cluster-containing dehydrogenase component
MELKNFKEEMSRKDFLKSAVVVGAGIAVATGAVTVSKLSPPPETPEGEETIKKIPDFKSITIDDKSDQLLIMQEELKIALAKPVEKRKWLMIIDTRKCVGCHACTIACIAENKLPPGVVYRPVIQEEYGVFPNPQLRFFPRPCLQCDNPPCVSVCPVHATWSRPDGIVQVDYDKCIGCRYCLSACPYGARTSDFGHFYTDEKPEFQQYEQKPSNEYGKNWRRNKHQSPIGNARKCHYCLHRLNEGYLPMCVTTCIGRANYFGDANNADSLVSKMARSANQIKLLPEKGTKPTVIYLI